MSAAVTRVGVVQITSTADVEANLAAVERTVRRAAGEGARLVVVPECFAYLGPEEGKLAVAGPFGKNDKSYRGLYIFNVSTIGEAQKLVERQRTRLHAQREALRENHEVDWILRHGKLLAHGLFDLLKIFGELNVVLGRHRDPNHVFGRNHPLGAVEPGDFLARFTRLVDDKQDPLCLRRVCFHCGQGGYFGLERT